MFLPLAQIGAENLMKEKKFPEISLEGLESYTKMKVRFEVKENAKPIFKPRRKKKF